MAATPSIMVNLDNCPRQCRRYAESYYTTSFALPIAVESDLNIIRRPDVRNVSHYCGVMEVKGSWAKGSRLFIQETLTNQEIRRHPRALLYTQWHSEHTRTRSVEFLNIHYEGILRRLTKWARTHLSRRRFYAETRLLQMRNWTKYLSRVVTTKDAIGGNMHILAPSNIQQKQHLLGARYIFVPA